MLGVKEEVSLTVQWFGVDDRGEPHRPEAGDLRLGAVVSEANATVRQQRNDSETEEKRSENSAR